MNWFLNYLRRRLWPQPAPPMITRQARTITHNSVSRYYEVDVPAKPVNVFGGGSPVIVCCHGGGSNPAAVRNESRFDELQALNGEFIMVYPRGTTNSFGSGYYWNDGRNFKDGSAQTADDVGFIETIVAQVASDFNGDLLHTYIAGYSNGAQMTHRLMHQASDTFAAGGTISGHRYPDAFFGDLPRPFPHIQFNGTSDLYGKYNGGTAIFDPVFETYTFPSAPNTRDAWALANGTVATAKITTINEAIEQQYDPGESGAGYTFWVLLNAGHNWPGGNTEDVPSLGSTNTDIWAAQEMWRFFKRYSLPA
ncbi:MAG: PHB depolymerase family esterase [Pirellulales bacterium]